MIKFKFFMTIVLVYVKLVNCNMLESITQGVQHLFPLLNSANLSNVQGFHNLIERSDSIFKQPTPSKINVPLNCWWGEQNAEFVDNSIRPFKVRFSDEVQGFHNLIERSDSIFKQPTPSKINVPLNCWWGEQNAEFVDNSIRPFKVRFSDEMIQDLRFRLQYRRNITRSLKNSVHTYGVNTDFLNFILQYWTSSYDFKTREKLLNRFPQYITNIQGLDIHFIHIKPETTKKVVPILLLHGYPMTAFEYHRLIEYLADETGDFVFEIVVPDLPGYGYSQATNNIGLNGYQVGIIMKNLMTKLGHDQFYIHCSDVGTWPGNALAVLFPETVLGLHTNLAFSLMPQTLVKLVLGSLYPSAVVEPKYQDRIYPLLKKGSELLENTGYLHMHGTRPDNVGIGLDESPVALAAWLIPLFIVAGEGSAGNNRVPDGNFFKNYHLDDIMDALTIYWDAQCATTAARFYAEEFAVRQDPNVMAIISYPIEVPFAVVKFKDEIIYMPDSFLQDKYKNIVQSTTLDYGGHYAALGTSVRDFAGSIWTAVAKMEGVRQRRKRFYGVFT